MNDPLSLQIEAMRASALGIVAQADALLAGLGVQHEDGNESLACPACGAKEFQARAGDVAVCGKCGVNYKDGEAVNE